jgi:hypothetical protein
MICIILLLSLLTDVVEGKSSFDCPMCRQSCIVPAGGIAGLPKNFALDSVISRVG